MIDWLIDWLGFNYKTKKENAVVSCCIATLRSVAVLKSMKINGVSTFYGSWRSEIDNVTADFTSPNTAVLVQITVYDVCQTIAIYDRRRLVSADTVCLQFRSSYITEEEVFVDIKAFCGSSFLLVCIRY